MGCAISTGCARSWLWLFSFTTRTHLSIAERTAEQHHTMSAGQQSATDIVELRPHGGSHGDYPRVEFSPCCGAPAADAARRVASSPPAETLSPDRHGAFLSGYTHARVFFTYL